MNWIASIGVAALLLSTAKAQSSDLPSAPVPFDFHWPGAPVAAGPLEEFILQEAFPLTRDLFEEFRTPTILLPCHFSPVLAANDPSE